MEQSPIDKLINDISKLPGLGRRSAQRIALFLLKNKDKNLSPLIESLNLSYDKIIECHNCGNIDMQNPCNVCSNNLRIGVFNQLSEKIYSSKVKISDESENQNLEKSLDKWIREA